MFIDDLNKENFDWIYFFDWKISVALVFYSVAKNHFIGI